MRGTKFPAVATSSSASRASASRRALGVASVLIGGAVAFYFLSRIPSAGSGVLDAPPGRLFTRPPADALAIDDELDRRLEELSGRSAGARPRDLPTLVARVKPNVVTLRTYGADGKSAGLGTGFYTSDVHIITNHHVVEGAYRVEVVSARGEVSDALGLAADDEDHDLALVEALRPAGAAPLVLGTTAPADGERVVVVGSPLGLAQTVSEGIVSSASRALPGGRTVVQVTAAISPGSSGSPVLTLDGRVVGVAVAQMVEGQALNFAVPVEHVRALKPGPVVTFAEWSGRKDRIRKEARRLVDLGNARMFDYPEFGSEGLSDDTPARRGAARAALPQFLRAVDVDPTWGWGWFELAGCYRAAGQHEDAIRAFTTAYSERTADRDTRREAVYERGLEYADLGRLEPAIESYDLALGIEPGWVLPLYFKGLALVEAGRDKEAYATLTSLRQNGRPQVVGSDAMLDDYFRQKDRGLRDLARAIDRFAADDFIAAAESSRRLARSRPDLARRYTALFGTNRRAPPG